MRDSKNSHGPFRPLDKQVIADQMQNESSAKEAYLKQFSSHYVSKNKSSKQLTEKFRKVYADQRAVSFFHLKIKELCFPIVYQQGDGAYVWDVDGNTYVDIAMDFGSNLFGHRPAFLKEALTKQLKEGWAIGMRPPKSAEAAAMLCHLTGQERAVFTQSGSEAVMTAIRLARQVSNKGKVVLFSNSYHGHSDVVLGTAVNDQGKSFTAPITAGTTMGTVQDLVLLPYCEASSLQVIAEQVQDLAAVVVEPVQSRGLHHAPSQFLQQLRQITEKNGVALIFDEMITGLRMAQGGAQELFGIKADMATYGKVLGGGMGIGAVAGGGKYMDAIDGGHWQYGDRSYPTVERTFFAGTHSQNTLAMASIHAVLGHLIQQGGSVQREVNRHCAQLAKRVNQFFEMENIGLKIEYFGSLFRFKALSQRNAMEYQLFLYHLRDNGVMVSEIGNNFLSAAHGTEELDLIVEAVRQSVYAMRKGGFFQNQGSRQSSVLPTTNAAPAANSNSMIENILEQLN